MLLKYMKSKVCGGTSCPHVDDIKLKDCDFKRAMQTFISSFFLQNILTDFILSHLNNENKQQQQMK